MTPEHRAGADARLVAARLLTLADDTGMAVPELQDMWVTETTDRLEQAAAAFAAADLVETRRQVHAAAGSAGLCGAEALAQALTSIENLAEAGQGEEAGRALDIALVDFRLLTAALDKGPPR